MTRSALPAVPAGWYPDPDGLPTLRWFDGSEWTGQLSPLLGTANLPLVVQEAPKPWTKREVPFTIKLIFAVLLVVFILAIVGGLHS
jgi:hypothetical protein